MSKHALTTQQVLTMLAEATPRLTALTADLTSVQLHTSLAAGEWSANEVLAHMRSCADMWGKCIAEIIAKDNPTIRAINPTTWIKSTDYLAQEFQLSLSAYATQRADLLSVLQALTPTDWSRSATVTGAGKVLERSVYFYAQWLARHEQPHIKQIKRLSGSS